MINLIMDLIEARNPIPFSNYSNPDVWGDERTFRRLKAKLNEEWEYRRGTPLFEIVDAAGQPAVRGERFLKILDQGIKTSKI